MCGFIHINLPDVTLADTNDNTNETHNIILTLQSTKKEVKLFKDIREFFKKNINHMPNKTSNLNKILQKRLEMLRQ